MIKLSVNINEVDNSGKTIAGITVDFKDFLILKNVAGLFEEKQAPKQEVDLSKVDRGALINELCKRPGVFNRVATTCMPFCVSVGSTKESNLIVKGPANIIVVANKEVEK